MQNPYDFSTRNYHVRLYRVIQKYYVLRYNLRSSANRSLLQGIASRRSLIKSKNNNGASSIPVRPQKMKS